MKDYERMGFLKYIEVDNFKSYRGKFRIGTLKQFTAVIGPNGSGKSNFMDAISFVLGEKTSSLRVKRLSDLIHGAPINQPVAHRASVTAVYQEKDNTEKRFTRIVSGSSSEYRIDDRPVNQQIYAEELEKLGINVKAKNFLVFQGAVESIAMKNPKERTALFEEISHSGDRKEEYDRLKAEMLKAEEDTQFSYQKKKGIAAERKEAKMEKEEADRYQKLRDEVAEKQVQYYLFKMFHCERDIEQYSEDLARKTQELDRVNKKKEKVEEELREKKREHGKLQRELAKLEQQIREAEFQLNQKRPTYIKAKERTAHMQKKLEAAKKSLKNAEKVNEAHQEEIDQLKKELDDVQQKRKEFEEQLEEESQSQGRDLHLEDSQVSEYQSLKEKAGKLSAMYMQDYETIIREQKTDQDRYDSEDHQKQALETRLRQREHELEEADKRLEKLTEFVRTNQKTLEEYKKAEAELETEVNAAKIRVAEKTNQIEKIVEQLGDAKVDKHEESRRRKKAEIVEHFKKLYPGVHGRMVDMCQPIHKRYNIAITKVLGKNMEAIVVDTEKTARSCIQYLKDQMLEAETFLPLDYIDAKPLKERLRSHKDSRNVKLLFDVLQFDPPAIRRAVLYATNNALVCETAEDANKVAYDWGDGKRYDAVALDGTYYQKNGFISGGSTDLEKRARRWDNKMMHQLKTSKEKLTEELKEDMKTTRKESELHTLQSQIKGIESRLKYSSSDKDSNVEKNVTKLQKEIRDLKSKLETFEPRMNQIKEAIDNRAGTIVEITNKKNNVEDEVFSDFCRQIGVENIRQYEEKELQAQQERAKKRLEFENQKYRLINQLEYEQFKNTSADVEKWTNEVKTDDAEYEKSKKAEATQRQLIDDEMQNLERLKNNKISKKTEVDNFEDETSEVRKRMASIQKDIVAAQKQVTSIESKIEQKKADRHSLLKTCKMEDIVLPMLRGNMDDVDQDGASYQADGDTEAPVDQSSGHSTRIMYEREAQIKIDYHSLDDDLKELDSHDEVKQHSDKLNKEITDMQLHLHRIQAPNMKAMEKLDGVRERFQETSEEFENARKRAKKAKQAFEKVKKARYDSFMQCFDHVSNRIDEIYKALAKNQSAQAFLGPENPEEPYLDGINYNCVAPGKRFQPMSNLSGGEKTVAALALLFAIHSYQPAPFFVLDEIDAALDNTNISKVASFIKEQTQTYFQCIVISLKEEFYGHADALIGICPDPGDCTISRVITLDLTNYADPMFDNRDDDLILHRTE